MTDPPPRTNWAGNVSFRAVHHHQPMSIDALRDIVARSAPVRALGCGHSFSPIADTAGDLIHMDRLPKKIQVDRVNATATVSSGVTYEELATALHAAGFALPTMASISHVTVGGACSTGTHGSGDHLRVLASSVAALQIVAADGQLLEVGRDTDHFPGCVIALGALGIMTQLILDIEPTYEMSQQVHLGVSLDELESRFDNVFGAAYSVSAFTDWSSGRADIWLKRRSGPAESPFSSGTPAQRRVHPISGISPDLCTEQLGVIGPWHERLPHFRSGFHDLAGNELQSEVFVARTLATQAIAALREIGDLIASVLLVSEIRTIHGDDLWLSPAHDRDSVAFHFTWIAGESAVLPVLAAVEECLMPFGPRPHWGKLTLMNARYIMAGFERASDFSHLMTEWDPTFKFRNVMLDSLFPRPS